MIDFDVEDDDLYSNCCGSRVKKKSLYRRVLTAAGIGPLVLLLEIVMGLSMWYSFSLITWDFSTFCSTCNLSYGTDLSTMGNEEKGYSMRCLNNAIDKVMMDDFTAFMSALVTSLAAHIIVMYSIIIDRKVPESVVALGFSKSTNIWHLLSYLTLCLDLIFEIADVIFITQYFWGDLDPMDTNKDYIFSENDGYTKCVAKEVTEISEMTSTISAAAQFIFWERVVFAFLVVVCNHLGNNSSLKPPKSSSNKLRVRSDLFSAKAAQGDDGFEMI